MPVLSFLKYLFKKVIDLRVSWSIFFLKNVNEIIQRNAVLMLDGPLFLIMAILMVFYFVNMSFHEVMVPHFGKRQLKEMLETFRILNDAVE
tara:strand:+ start:227 stop:499 length:273 start_codon:yes stop_codon:yes gene_type:complete